MKGVTALIPVRNLVSRGLDRLDLELYSLERQTVPVAEIIVIDGSDANQSGLVRNIALKKARHIKHPMKQFNMPILYNIAIKRAHSDYLLMIGADFLFEKNFIEVLLKELDDRTFCICQTIDLPANLAIDKKAIDNSWNDLVITGEWHRKCGDGIQAVSRDWLHKVRGYDERMVGWGGMDNQLHNRAAKDGLHIKWLSGTTVLHQWHAREKHIKVGDIKQTEKNWHIRDHDSPIVCNPDHWGESE